MMQLTQIAIHIARAGPDVVTSILVEWHFAAFAAEKITDSSCMLMFFAERGLRMARGTHIRQDGILTRRFSF